MRANKVLWYIDQTPHNTQRLFINLESRSAVLDHEYETRVLKELSCWQGADKDHDCKDGTHMKSWEFSHDEMPALRRFLQLWKQHGWQESNYNEVWKD